MKIAALLALAAASGSAQAQLYICVEDGKKVIRQQPCTTTKPRPAESSPREQNSSSTARNPSPSPSLGHLAKQGHSVTAVTPVYSQLVMFSYPPGFKPAFAKDSGPSYIQEYVLEGETVAKWTQMVTLTGVKGLAANQALTPQRVVEQIAGGFQRACPSSFAAQSIGTLKVSGYDAFVALFGCGTVSNGPPRSEVALILAVKGSADYYTIQWAERASQSAQRPVLDREKWLGRLKRLSPIKVCDRIRNEPAPYPSCINQK